MGKFGMAFIGIAVAAGFAAAASAASAAIIHVDFSGTVSSGADGDGLFGAIGLDLAGDAFSAEFVFDNSGGTATLPGTIQSAELTINGIQQSVTAIPDPGVAPANYGLIAIANGQAVIAASPIADSFTPVLPLFLQSISTDFTNVGGVFTVNGGGYGLFNLGNTTGLLDPTVATVDTAPLISNIPEPSAWALAILGLGLTGLALRQRRQALTA